MRYRLLCLIPLLAACAEQGPTAPSPSHVTTVSTIVDGSPQIKIYQDGKLRFQSESKMTGGQVRYVNAKAFDKNGKIACTAARVYDSGGKPIMLDEFDVPTACQNSLTWFAATVTFAIALSPPFSMGGFTLPFVLGARATAGYAGWTALSNCGMLDWISNWVYEQESQIDYSCAPYYAYDTQYLKCVYIGDIGGGTQTP